MRTPAFRSRAAKCSQILPPVCRFWCEVFRMSTLFPLLKETIASWSAHNAQKMGAALAYYTALSLAPLVIMVVGVAGMLVSKDKVRKEVVNQVSEFVGEAGKNTVDSILANPANHKAGKW